MTDSRRVSEVSPAELIEAGLAAMGWRAGQWKIELAVTDGTIRKVTAVSSTGRSALLRTGELPSGVILPMRGGQADGCE